MMDPLFLLSILIVLIFSAFALGRWTRGLDERRRHQGPLQGRGWTHSFQEKLDVLQGKVETVPEQIRALQESLEALRIQNQSLQEDRARLRAMLHDRPVAMLKNESPPASVEPPTPSPEGFADILFEENQ